MLGKPKFKLSDWVKFNWQGKEVEGEVWVVDAFGTFFQDKEPSYDIFCAESNMLYKHIEESSVQKINTPEKSKYKVIFLDFDGVITTLASGWCICPKKMELLGEIIAETDAKIVISSTWRRGTLDETIKFITGGDIHAKQHPFKFADRVIGITDRLVCLSLNEKTNEITGRKPTYDVPRGVEIDKWLDENEKDIKSYVILDDDSDMLLVHKDNFVQTDPFSGLSKKDVKKAIKILNQDENNN